jgi:hypothetical protein
MLYQLSYRAAALFAKGRDSGKAQHSRNGFFTLSSSTQGLRIKTRVISGHGTSNVWMPDQGVDARDTSLP